MVVHVGENPAFRVLREMTKHKPQVGYGIDNIFKCISVTALYRLSYRNNPNVQQFGLKINYQFKL